MIQHILPAERDLPLHGAAASRAVEQAALAGRPERELMERAGLAVARLALALQPREGTIWVAAGPGHNGEDGRIAGRWLQAQGRTVQIGLQAPTEPVALAIDALLGLGLNRPPEPAMATAIAALNALDDAIIVAVDLPSGLLSGTGALAGDEAVRADHTLSLLTLKPGLFTAQGRDHAGTIWFDDLGVAPAVPPDALLLGRHPLPQPLHGGHKGSQGDVIVVGGSVGMGGAQRLAARAALAAGAGRVWLHRSEPDPGRPELMQAQDLALAGRTIVAGCGGGTAIAQDLTPILQQAERLVLDADGLNALAADASLLTLLQGRAAPTIITPHPLEAARLLRCTTAELQADRLQAAQALAERLRCTVVLKGSGSVIAAPGRLPLLNASGSAALATAGTGDVLAGWIAGLWAQQPQADPQRIAATAVHWHGRAGELHGDGPLRAADLIDAMHALHGWARVR